MRTPIHEGHNPSFGYNYGKDRYHCFTCSADGDLIKLWSKVKGSGNLTDDFKAFCRLYNIPLEHDHKSQSKNPI